MMMPHATLSSANAELVYTRAFADDDYGSYHVAVLNAVFKQQRIWGYNFPSSSAHEQSSDATLLKEADVL